MRISTKYTLHVSNAQGAYQRFCGDTIAETLSEFDSFWERKGWRMVITNNLTQKDTIIKKTTR